LSAEPAKGSKPVTRMGTFQHYCRNRLENHKIRYPNVMPYLKQLSGYSQLTIPCKPFHLGDGRLRHLGWCRSFIDLHRSN
jgi:hypothetical protein